MKVSLFLFIGTIKTNNCLLQMLFLRNLHYKTKQNATIPFHTQAILGLR